MARFSFLLCIFLLLPGQGSAAAGRAKEISGPVEAAVLRVLDGDTFLARVFVWPGHDVTVKVRIRGIDAPEIRSRCAREKRAARRSQLALSSLIGNNNVQLFNIGADKYFGRVLADVVTWDGGAVADALLEKAVVVSYDGGRRSSYCANS